jgi:hypothetical protein
MEKKTALVDQMSLVVHLYVPFMHRRSLHQIGVMLSVRPPTVLVQPCIFSANILAAVYLYPRYVTVIKTALMVRTKVTCCALTKHA